MRIGLTILLVIFATAARSDQYEFERYWPPLAQPWYFDGIVGAVAATDGDLYIIQRTAAGGPRLHHLSPDGFFVTSADLGNLGQVEDLAISDSDKLHVLTRGEVVEYDAQLAYVRTRFWSGASAIRASVAVCDDTVYITRRNGSTGSLLVLDDDATVAENHMELGRAPLDLACLGDDPWVLAKDGTQFFVEPLLASGSPIEVTDTFSGFGIDDGALAIDRDTRSFYVFASDTFLSRLASYGESGLRGGREVHATVNLFAPFLSFGRRGGVAQLTTSLDGAGVQQYPIENIDDGPPDFNTRLEPSRNFGPQTPTLGPTPNAIRVDAAGNVYVKATFQVIKYSPAGALLNILGVAAVDIATYGNHLYALTLDNEYLVYDSGGQLIRTVELEGDSPALGLPLNRFEVLDDDTIALATAGIFPDDPGFLNVYTAGQLTRQIRHTTFGIGRGQDGVLYSLEKGTFIATRIVGYDKNLAEVSSFPYAHVELDIAATADGTIVVSDGTRVRLLDQSGTELFSFGQRGVDGSSFAHVAGHDVAEDGRIFTIDSLYTRIQAFRPVQSGNRTRAIIVAGGGPYAGNNLWDTTRVAGNLAYRALAYQGFSRDDIMYLSADTAYDLDGNGAADDIDADATIANLNAALAWAAQTGTEDVVLYMVDHGGVDTFRMNSTEILHAQDLSSALDNLQAALPGHLTFIYDACESGSFQSALGGTLRRRVITSTSPGENALFLSSGAVSFSGLFWTMVFNGASLGDAFDSTTTALDSTVPHQHPMLNADGDGLSNTPADLNSLRFVTLGNGTAVAGSAPTIVSASQPQSLAAGTDAATVTAMGVEDSDGIDRVWAVIRPPRYTPGTSGDPVRALPTQETDFTARSLRAGLAYDALIQQGFADGDITYLAPVAPAGVDAAATPAALMNAIESADEAGETLLLYLAAQIAGSDVILDGEQRLALSDISNALASRTNPRPAPDVVVLEAALDEAIASHIVAADRIVLGAGESAFNAEVSFGAYFWRQIFSGGSVGAAFTFAEAATTLSRAAATLEANANLVPNEKDDRRTANRRFVGHGILLAGDEPVVGNAEAPPLVPGGEPWQATLAHVTGTAGSVSVFVLITSPDNEVRRLDALQTGDGFHISTAFDAPGTHQVAIYAADTTGAVSLPRVLQVEVDGEAPATTGRFENLSTRGWVGSGDQVLIGGLIVGGTEPTSVVVRARGPSLADFGVPGTLADPILSLFSGPDLIGYNDDWASVNPTLGDIREPLYPTQSREAATARRLNPGPYTAIVEGFLGATGIGIVEVFEESGVGALTNISTRGFVSPGDNVMIGGLIIADGPMRVAFRGRGPSLTGSGVPDALADPRLTLLKGQNVVTTADNWQDHESAGAMPTHLMPAFASESAFVVTLEPGSYTAIVEGVGATSGNAIVEAFRID